MTILFIHGVPDTHRLWDETVSHLGASNVICPDLPGFGCDVPDGFDGTMDAHADWLAHSLYEVVEQSGGPVHLVGHDWGGLLVQRVAGLHPDMVKTWAAGGVAIDPDYVWHDIAQVWQTPGEGEALMAATDPALMTAMLVDARVPTGNAEAMAGFADERMKEAILTLYRSATTIGTDWQDSLDGLAKRPGLVLWGEHDPYASLGVGETLARRTGARFQMFSDCGHWWPYERPAETAASLQAHWRSAP